MKRLNPPKPPLWTRVAPFIIGVFAFGLVLHIVPGASCRDGTASSAIGHRGACSHHRGVSVGWGFVGVPIGLFAGVLTANLIDGIYGQRRKRHEESVKEAWAASASTKAQGLPPNIRANEHSEAFLRRVMGTGKQVSFTYAASNAGEQSERTVLPRWLQMSEVDGSQTLCLIADCSTDGRMPFALAKMNQLHLATMTTAGNQGAE